MIRSLFAGVSGLRNHQIAMDVIANNIANVNTIGFKTGRVTFAEIFNQTIRGSSGPQDEHGGTNPQQVGLGVTVASIDAMTTQGNLQPTGQMTDMAIQGNGFFLLKDNDILAFTRAGAFGQDALGYLIDPSSGLRLQGWMATGGTFPTFDENTLTDIQIPVGQTLVPQATTTVSYGNNLDSTSSVGYTIQKPVEVFDSQGNTHNLQITFEKTADNTWNWTAGGPAGVTGNGSVTFTPTGAFNSQSGGPITFSPDGVNVVSIDPDFSGMTQFAAATTVSAIDRDGYAMGSLDSFTIDSSGVITGVYSNGLTQELARIALAAFSNPGGLLKRGGNLLLESNNSGMRQIGEAGTGGRGVVAPGSLEMSNVDLSREFTNMIVIQRGFQANSRVITTSDEMLQELVNLKR